MMAGRQARALWLRGKTFVGAGLESCRPGAMGMRFFTCMGLGAAEVWASAAMTIPDSARRFPACIVLAALPVRHAGTDVSGRARVVDGDSLVASGQRRRARRQAVVCGGRHTLAVRRFGDPRQRIGTPRPTPGFSATRPAAGSFAAATSSLDISHGVVEVCDDLPRERLHEREGALRVTALNDHYRDNVLMR